MLQNARVTAFTVSELLREKYPPTPPSRLGLSYIPIPIEPILNLYSPAFAIQQDHLTIESKLYPSIDLVRRDHKFEFSSQTCQQAAPRTSFKLTPFFSAHPCHSHEPLTQPLANKK